MHISLCTHQPLIASVQTILSSLGTHSAPFSSHFALHNKKFTFILASLVFISQKIASGTLPIFVVRVQIANHWPIGMQLAEGWLLLGLEVLIIGGFEVNMLFGHFWGWRVGGLNVGSLASGLAFIFLLIFFKVGGERWIDFPQLNRVHLYNELSILKSC